MDHPELHVPASPSTDLWAFTRDELQESALFHGTGEPLDGTLRGGGYDGLLWTARSAGIAQTYLPAAGASVLYSAPREWEMDQPVAPRWNEHDLEIRLARQMGHEFRIHETAENGQVLSWSWPGAERAPTKGEIFRYITETLGYAPRPGRDAYQLLLSSESDTERDPAVRPDEIQPAAWRRQGTLAILLPTEELRILDMAATGESDLMDLQYHSHAVFSEAREAGFHGVRIHDFAQSTVAGNVPHRSIGLFPAGIERVRIHTMPAVHHDWGDRFQDETPDLVTGHQAAVAGALSAGDPVPSRVRTEHRGSPTRSARR